MARSLLLKRGAIVRLKSKFETRGGRVYHAGVCFEVCGTDREYLLRTKVRARVYYIRITKKYSDHYLELVSAAPSDEAEEPEEVTNDEV